MKLSALAAAFTVLAVGCGKLGADKPMPISNANCSALWVELKNIVDNTPASARQESFQREFLITAAYSALTNLGFDPDKTVRSLAFLPIDPRGTCHDMPLLVPSEPRKAKEKGLINDRTLQVLEAWEQLYMGEGSKSGMATVDAVSQCEKNLISPCPITEMIGFLQGDTTYNGKSMEQIIKDRDSFGLTRLGCDDQASMRLLLNEKREIPSCGNINSDTTLSVNRDKVAVVNQSRALLDEEKKSLGF